MTQDRITVPNLSAQALVAQAKEKLSLTYCGDYIAAWNFITDECSKTYEVLTHRSGDVSSDTIRAFFRERGFTGNTAAFVAWVTEKNPEGYYASIPEDDCLWRIPGYSGMCAPFFCRNGANSELDMNDVRHGWWDEWDDWIFVAFRELPQST